MEIPQESLEIKKKFDTAPGGFFITDKHATILYANRTLETKTGYSVHETVGKTPGKLWGRQMSQAFYKKLWDTIKNKKQPFTSEVKNRTKSGELFDETMRIAPIFENDEIAYYIALQPAHNHTGIEKEFSEFMRQGQRDPSLFTKKLGAWILEDSLTLPQAVSASEFLRSYFIEPMTDVYKNRREDKELLLFAQQKMSSFNALYEKYYKTIFEYFSRRLNGDKDISFDLTQETFLRAFAHLSTFVPSNASYQTYLMRIAHNILVNHYRKVLPVTLDEFPDIAEKVPKDTLDFFSLKEGMETLSPEEKEILSLVYEQGYALKEVAEKKSKTENAVKLQISRIRKKLRHFLEK